MYAYHMRATFTTKVFMQLRINPIIVNTTFKLCLKYTEKEANTQSTIAFYTNNNIRLIASNNLEYC